MLIKPDPARRIGWRARYVDPDSGRTVKETLDASLTTVEARDDWCARKSKALAKRRLELEGGAPRATGTDLEKAVDRYYDDHPHLRPKTVRTYRDATNKFKAWAKRTSLYSADDLTGAKLVAFRATLVKESKTVATNGGKRGQRRDTEKPRSAHTINRELRAVGTVLTYLRRLGLLPRLTSDALSDGFQKLKAAQKRIHYLRPHELQKLLEAALRHDNDTFKLTREEHAGRGKPGSTRRYTPIAPVVAGALITGLRFGHLIDLEWSDVDLDALDEHGNKVGEITPEGGSHTKRTGVIGLEVSPALGKLLAWMKLASGGEGSVFGLSRDEANAALKRTLREYGAPKGSTWQAFRRTCGTYLTNAPGIFGASSAYRSARQLGHSVQIAERHYAGLLRGIPRGARTLEAVMQIDNQMERIIDAVSTPRAKASRV